MHLAGPSRLVPLPSRERIESTYEQDLHSLLHHLSLEERDEFQASLNKRISAGGHLSDYDVALNLLIQQARELDAFNEDRMLAERIAVEEDSDVPVHQAPTPQPEPSPPDPQPNSKSKKRRRSKRKSRVGEVPQGSALGSLPYPIHERKEQFAAPQTTLRPSDPPLSSQKGKETEREANRQRGVPDAPVSSPAPVRWGKAGIPSGPRFAFGSLPSEPGPTNVAVPPRATKVKRPTGHDCVICQDPIYDTEIQAPCGHHYDIPCVTTLFRSATRDETLFPPRCCKQTIPFIQVRSHLSQNLIATFQKKKVEFGTLKRVYCSSPTCSRFLGPLLEHDSKAYTCPCSTKTCGKCREQHSTGVNRVHVCRPDATATDVLELGRASGWARCPGCSQMIELDVGCFHMTCRCRTEFCYLCRARWKTCPCDQWDEQRLLTAAERRVDAQLGAGRGQDVRHDAAPQQQRRDPALMDNPFAVLLDDDQQAVHPTRTEPAGSRGPLERRRPGRFEDAESEYASTPDEADWLDVAPNMNAIRARMVLEMMERLRIDHDCDHIQWRYQDDGGYCDNCGDYLPLYLFRCDDCEMLACNQCRRNRL